jgi:hypothetical protein
MGASCVVQCVPALDYIPVVPIANYCFTLMFTVQYIRIVRLYDGPVGCWLELFAATDRETFRSGDVVFGARAYRCPRYERGSMPTMPPATCSLRAFSPRSMTGQLQRSKSKESSGMAYGVLQANVTQKIFRLMLRRVPLQQVSSNHWSRSRWVA